MNRTIIIGDIHLGRSTNIGKPGIGNALNSRIVDQSKILDWILEQGIDNYVNRFIITGDIFHDVKPDTQLLSLFVGWLKKCENHNIEVHIIIGNHDIKRTGSVYVSILDFINAADIENTTIYKNIYTLHTDGVCFTLLPFKDRLSLNCKTTVEALKQIEDRLPYELYDIPVDCDKVLIGHLAIKGSFYTGEVGDASIELMCPLEMFNGYDYVWMGHVHTPQVLSEKPRISHIGSIDISDFGECNQTKWIVLYDPQSKEKFNYIRVPSRPLFVLEHEVGKGEDPTESLLNIIKIKDLKDGIVKIEVKHLDPDGPELDRRVITEAIYAKNVYYIYNISEIRTINVVPEDKKELVDTAIDVKSAIKLWADLSEFDDDYEKAEFIAFCNEVVDECAK